MKKQIAMAAMMLLAGAMSSGLQAQEQVNEREAKKAEKAAERQQRKAEEQAQAELSYQKALKALQDQQFVLEADQAGFRNGQTAYVSSNTNFVLVNGERGTVQVAFNTAQAGPNGIGGVTVDGSISKLKMKTDKKGNVNCNFTIQGTGISAQIFLTLSNGNNTATVTVSPNFNSRTLSLSGNLLPLQESNVYKGRSW